MLDIRFVKAGELLNNTVSPEKRIVTYNGIATVLSMVIINHITNSNKTVEAFKGMLPLVVRNVSYRLNEMGVVDIPLMVKTITSHVDFRTKTVKDDNDLSSLSYSTSCFEDTLKITTYFSKETIDLINNNYKDFKAAMLVAINLKEVIKETISND